MKIRIGGVYEACQSDFDEVKGFVTDHRYAKTVEVSSQDVEAFKENIIHDSGSASIKVLGRYTPELAADIATRWYLADRGGQYALWYWMT